MEKIKFNRLTLIRDITSDKSEYMCDCGNHKIMYRRNVATGKSKSCGCLHAERTRSSNTKHGFARTNVSLFYKRYQSIKNRCTNPNDESFKRYGAKGVKIIWKSFNEFRDDMYDSFHLHVNKFGINDTQIDRIDYNGNYSKENCRWVTRKEQARNKSNNKWLTFNGCTKVLPEWADIMGISSKELTKRLWRGWSVEKALTTPIKHSKI